uniref:Uncharacterized protein n=2 Tax=Viruses TaxID=10239 RepID=A0AAU8KW76_9CAUD
MSYNQTHRRASYLWGGWCNSHRLSAFWQAISYRVRHIASNYTYSTTTY